MSFLTFSQSLEAFNKKVTVAIDTSLMTGRKADEVINSDIYQKFIKDYFILWAKNENLQLTFSPENANLFVDIQPTQLIDKTKLLLDVPVDLSINLHKTLSATNKLEQLIPYAIGVLHNSLQHHLITQLHPKLSVKSYDSTNKLYQAALAGEVLAFVDIKKQREDFENFTELLTDFPAYRQINYQRLHLVVESTNKELINYVKRTPVSLDTARDITKHWFGEQGTRQQLVIGYSHAHRPYIHQAKNTAEGFLVELWQLWSEYNHLDVVFEKVDIDEVSDKLSAGLLDLYICFEDKLVDEDYQPLHTLYQSSLHFFVKNEQIGVNHLEQLNGLTIAIQANLPSKSLFIERYPDINFVSYQDISDILLPSNINQIDGFVAEYQVTQALLKEAKLTHSFSPLMHKKTATRIQLFGDKNNQELRQLVSQGFDLVPDRQLINLEKLWLDEQHQRLHFEAQSLKISLPKHLSNWLEKQSAINVGMVNNWSPVEFVDGYGDLVGINPDFFELIATRIGNKFNYRVFDTWNELLAALKNKQVDVIATVSETKDRADYIGFSDSYWSMPRVLVHPVTGGNKALLSDFYDKKVAILSGHHTVDILKKSHPKLILQTIDSLDDGYNLLQKGKVSALITSLAPASELLKRESLITMGISVIENLAEEKEQFGIRKDWPELLELFNLALDSISEDEKKAILDKWFNVEITTGYEKNLVIKLAVQIGVFTLIVIAVIVFWNRRLYHEIKRRKKLEEQMKHMATHDELTGLANRALLNERINSSINFHKRQNLSLAVLFIDLDGFKHVNDNYGHDVGDELLVQLTARLKNCVRESDTVARFGGDEFVLLLTGLHDKKEAAFIAEKALKVIRKPVELSAAKVAVSCSIGIASFPQDGNSDTDLLKVADTLMYRVKAHGKNHYLFRAC